MRRALGSLSKRLAIPRIRGGGEEVVTAEVVGWGEEEEEEEGEKRLNVPAPPFPPLLEISLLEPPVPAATTFARESTRKDQEITPPYAGKGMLERLSEASVGDHVH